MATLNKGTAATVGGVLAGAGGTAFMREHFDQANDDAVTRPSVIYGLGTGLGAGALTVFKDDIGRGTLPPLAWDFLEAHAIAGVASGTTSALFPKGSTTASTPSIR